MYAVGRNKVCSDECRYAECHGASTPSPNDLKIVFDYRLSFLKKKQFIILKEHWHFLNLLGEVLSNLLKP
jgi:hypothetical protein